MGKVFLRMFSVETLIGIVIELLAQTVKNPGSPEAVRLRSIVARLHDATGAFLNEAYFGSGARSERMR